MRHLLSFSVLLIICVVSVILAPKAHAQYSLCNKSSYALRASIGYVDGDRVATRGWWQLNSGECKIVLTEKVKAGRYFLYGEAIDGHQGQKRVWSGEARLCIQNIAFFNRRNQEVCRDQPHEQRGFMDIEVTSSTDGTLTTDFVEAQNFTSYSAEIAGVQRLLSDVGLSIKNIDGTMGSETRRAIATYRKKRGLAIRNGIDEELMNTLIEEANTIDSKLGFFYCNKTASEVWSAIAFPKQDNYVSQGWWRLEPGQCTKILKGKLTHDHYYVYGVIGGEGSNEAEQILSGGNKVFCINDVLFEVTNGSGCSEQDLSEGMFKKVEIGGSPAATYNFEQQAFVPSQPAPAP